MQKHITLLIIICLLLHSLIGCSERDADSSGQSNNDIVDGVESSKKPDDVPDQDGSDDHGTIPDDYFLEKPETNLEFWIAENVDNVDFSKYNFFNVAGARGYYGTGYIPIYDKDHGVIDPEFYVQYTVTGYPDVMDSTQHITTIKIKDPKVHVYGLTVESSFEEFEHIMEQNGFEVTRIAEVAGIAKKGRFSIQLSTVVKTIHIRVEKENKGGWDTFD